MNYKNGKMYRINNDIDDEFYIGGTTQKLSPRMAGHRQKVLDGRTSTLYNHMRALGVEHFRIVLIEKFPCESKEELRAREDALLREMKPTLNSIQAVRDMEKKRETHARCSRAYMKAYPEKVKALKKIYREKNK